MLRPSGRKLDERHGRLRRRARGDALQRIGDEVARAPLRLGRGFLLHLADAAGELVAHLLLRVVEYPLPRLAARHAGDPLELAAVRVLQLLHVLLQLAEVNLAVGDALLAPNELRELAVDVVLLRDHALLDLHDLVAALAELRFELGAKLDRLLARLDAGLAPRHLGVTLRLVENEVPLPARCVKARASNQPQRDECAGDSGGGCNHDCHDDEHGRSYGLVARTTHLRRRSACRRRLCLSAAGAPYRSQVRGC